jgi:hypothetical protein
MRPVAHTDNKKLMEHSGVGQQIILKRILNTVYGMDCVKLGQDITEWRVPVNFTMNCWVSYKLG